MLHTPSARCITDSVQYIPFDAPLAQYIGESKLAGVYSYAIHMDDDVFDSVTNGMLSASDFANLMLHEGMHTVVDPSTGVGYKHPGVNGPPYPLPFALVNTGMRLCVNN